MRSNPRAYSLTEVIIASVILLSTVLIVFSAIPATRHPVVESGASLRAAIFAQRVLDDLRGSIDENSFNDAAGSPFQVGVNHVIALAADEAGFAGSNYNVFNDNGSRRVVVVVNYNKNSTLLGNGI